MVKDDISINEENKSEEDTKAAGKSPEMDTNSILEPEKPRFADTRKDKRLVKELVDLTIVCPEFDEDVREVLSTLEDQDGKLREESLQDLRQVLEVPDQRQFDKLGSEQTYGELKDSIETLLDGDMIYNNSSKKVTLKQSTR